MHQHDATADAGRESLGTHPTMAKHDRLNAAWTLKSSAMRLASCP